MGKRIRTFLIAAITFGFTLAPTLAATASASPTFNQYSTPTTSAAPQQITAGPDGDMWFTEELANKIGRITPSGNITEFSLPGSQYSSYPYAITTGPDGALWFTEEMGNAIGRITTDGSVTIFSLPGGNLSSTGITTGPDGALWFTGNDTIGRITISGDITEYPISTDPTADPNQITTGPDGALWFTEEVNNKIGRITTSGSITEYTLSPSGSDPTAIITGPDGALWFTQGSSRDIGRITTTGSVTEYPYSASYGNAIAITTGPDGALWIAIDNYGYTSNIAQMAVSGEITNDYSIPFFGASPNDMAIDSNGSFWFTEYNISEIGNFSLASAPTNLTAQSPTQNPALSWDAVSDAASYNIYRDGARIDSTTNTTYIDNSASEGTHTYYVTAVDSTGNESDPSNTINVVVDRTRPVVTVTPVAGSTLSGIETFNITVTDNNPLDPSKNKSDWVYLYDTAGAQKHWGAKVDLSSGSGTFTIDTTKLDNGNANLDVGIVYDAAGNASGTSDNYFRNYTIAN